MPVDVQARSGDVDPNGDLVDQLRERLRKAITPARNVSGQKQLERVLRDVCRAKGIDLPAAGGRA
jgi:hypothetical protein